ncbi:RINGv domain-containing protein [Cephalotus follicularis]|uniref:RINGv domain-containing protein n=1 Tax=Cephalotus follicularis TaxID=3775 RepID=A0A1Q3AMF8_CEPFO|nr:RINGv domain-containing protein [Cephalotus follicularis]
MASVTKPHVVVINVGVFEEASSGGGGGGGQRSSDPGRYLGTGDQSDEEEQRCSTSSSSSLSESGGAEIKERRSSVSEVDLECGGGGVVVTESKVHLAKVERDCRICQLSLDVGNQESGVPIELGCSCKDDLAVAHKQCAEAWFKIKGNKTCEICGSIARNVAGANEVESMEQWNDTIDAAAATAAPAHAAENQNFWQGHRFINFLLACMVFAFVISWFFHFNVPS